MSSAYFRILGDSPPHNANDSSIESACVWERFRLRFKTVNSLSKHEKKPVGPSRSHGRQLMIRVVGLDGELLQDARCQVDGLGRGRIELPTEAACVVFAPPESRLENASALVERFKSDPRIAAIAPRRMTSDGSTLPSACLKPTWLDLACRLLTGWSSRRGLMGLGLPISEFRHDRELSVGAVHPYAWAVRAAHWDELDGVTAKLDWEYGVQDFIDRASLHGLEVFFIPEVRIVGVSTETDPWCRPSRDLAALLGLFGYVRRRWGSWRARVFRWIFKPLFLVRLCLALAIRTLMRWRMKPSKVSESRTLSDAGDIARFLWFDLFTFMRAK